MFKLIAFIFAMIAAAVALPGGLIGAPLYGRSYYETPIVRTVYPSPIIKTYAGPIVKTYGTAPIISSPIYTKLRAW